MFVSSETGIENNAKISSNNQPKRHTQREMHGQWGEREKRNLIRGEEEEGRKDKDQLKHFKG